MTVFVIVSVYLLLPQSLVTGKTRDNLKKMDWLGSICSLAMSICLLVSMFPSHESRDLLILD